MRLSAFALGALLASALLAGCGSAPSQTADGPTQIPIYNKTTHKKLTQVDAALGLMVPQVANYHCDGTYVPAATVKQTATTVVSQIAMPFWQLTVICNPDKQPKAAKGSMRAGTVWVTEMPSASASLLEAIHAVSPISDLRVTSVGRLPVGIGKVVFGGYDDNLLWLFGGKTQWTDVGKVRSGTVLAYLTGRSVPTPTLKQFAKSMRPLSQVN